MFYLVASKLPVRGEYIVASPCKTPHLAVPDLPGVLVTGVRQVLIILVQIQARIAASVSQSLELFCRLQKGDQNQPGIGSRLLHKICVVLTEYQQ